MERERKSKQPEIETFAADEATKSLPPDPEPEPPTSYEVRHQPEAEENS